MQFKQIFTSLTQISFKQNLTRIPYINRNCLFRKPALTKLYYTAQRKKTINKSVYLYKIVFFDSLDKLAQLKSTVAISLSVLTPYFILNIFYFFRTLWYQAVTLYFFLKTWNNILGCETWYFSIENNFSHVSPETFYCWSTDQPSMSFCRKAYISYKRNLLDKHNMWVLKKAPVLFYYIK